MNTEVVYLGHGNRIDLLLKADGVAVALTSVTMMTLTVGTTLIDSNNGAADPIQWAKVGYATGEIRIILGAQTILGGKYNAPLIVYDATNEDGIVWGMIPILVKAEVEAPTPTP